MDWKIKGAILVIDDDDDDHVILKEICKDLGVCDYLKFFYSSQQLLTYLRTAEEHPFMILCDINMPQVNGLDLREILWKDLSLRHKSIPFIFFSTTAAPAQVNKAFDLTVQGFFEKGNCPQETSRKLKLIFDYWAESKHPYY
jgi:CheY-like chemotaxis protein